MIWLFLSAWAKPTGVLCEDIAEGPAREATINSFGRVMGIVSQAKSIRLEQADCAPPSVCTATDGTVACRESGLARVVVASAYLSLRGFGVLPDAAPDSPTFALMVADEFVTNGPSQLEHKLVTLVNVPPTEARQIVRHLQQFLATDEIAVVSDRAYPADVYQLAHAISDLTLGFLFGHEASHRAEWRKGNLPASWTERSGLASKRGFVAVGPLPPNQCGGPLDIDEWQADRYGLRVLDAVSGRLGQGAWSLSGRVADAARYQAANLLAASLTMGFAPTGFQVDGIGLHQPEGGYLPTPLRILMTTGELLHARRVDPTYPACGAWTVLLIDTVSTLDCGAAWSEGLRRYQAVHLPKGAVEQLVDGTSYSCEFTNR